MSTDTTHGYERVRTRSAASPAPERRMRRRLTNPLVEIVGPPVFERDVVEDVKIILFGKPWHTGETLGIMRRVSRTFRLRVDKWMNHDGVDQAVVRWLCDARRHYMRTFEDYVLRVSQNLSADLGMNEGGLILRCADWGLQRATSVLLSVDRAVKGVDFGKILMDACRYGHLEIVRSLVVDRGVDVNQIQAGWYWTPLMYAAYRGHALVVSFLLSRGADVHARDRDIDGETALSFAQLLRHQNVVDLLEAAINN